MSAAVLHLPAAILVERMMKRVEKRDDGCWIFTGCVNSKGYGCVSSGRKGKTVLAHRLVVIARDGSVGDEMTVDHTCEIKRCVNPAHLQVVTRPENSSLRFTRHAVPASSGGGFDFVAIATAWIESLPTEKPGRVA